MSLARNWHLFCRVIDNFGDIGVCWRLAKQLHHKHGQQVTLWVDDINSFQALCPSLDVRAAMQIEQGIVVRQWLERVDAAPIAEADVVIEAFACDLPAAVIDQMRVKQPLWLNLEYLSAEDWVDGFHGSSSPVAGMNKIFFFPGFSAKTGGLLWEPELLQLPQRMQQPQERQQLFRELGLAPDLAALDLQISLFAYENPQVPSLLEALSQQRQSVHLLVPQGRVSADVEAWAGVPLTLGKPYQRGSLQISTLPFMEQSVYDRLLASCQLNLVRGEESFVRAQMLGLPLLWHIYPQQEDAHLVKLNAFLERYCAGCESSLAASIKAVMRAWNEPRLPAPKWAELLMQLQSWSQQAQNWQAEQANHGDLASNLVHYAANTV